MKCDILFSSVVHVKRTLILQNVGKKIFFSKNCKTFSLHKDWDILNVIKAECEENTAFNIF